MLIQLKLKRILKKLFSIKKLIIFSSSLILLIVFFLIHNDELHSQVSCTDCSEYSSIVYALEYVDTYNYHFNPRQYYDHDGEEFINDIGNPCHYHYHQEQLGRYKLYEVYNRKDHEYIADCCIIISPILLDDPSPTLICDQSKAYVPCDIPAEFNGGQEVGDCCE